jgi:hypothetical protein
MRFLFGCPAFVVPICDPGKDKFRSGTRSKRMHVCIVDSFGKAILDCRQDCPIYGENLLEVAATIRRNIAIQSTAPLLHSSGAADHLLLIRADSGLVYSACMAE